MRAVEQAFFTAGICDAGATSAPVPVRKDLRKCVQGHCETGWVEIRYRLTELEQLIQCLRCPSGRTFGQQAIERQDEPFCPSCLLLPGTVCLTKVGAGIREGAKD